MLGAPSAFLKGPHMSYNSAYGGLDSIYVKTFVFWKYNGHTWFFNRKGWGRKSKTTLMRTTISASRSCSSRTNKSWHSVSGNAVRLCTFICYTLHRESPLPNFNKNRDTCKLRSKHTHANTGQGPFALEFMWFWSIVASLFGGLGNYYAGNA